MTAFYVVIYIIPLFITLLKGCSEIFSVVTDLYYVKIMLFTIFQASLSAAISVIAGLPGAWITSCTSFKGKRIINTIFRLPSVLPSTVAVLGFVVFFGKTGVLNTFLTEVFKLDSPPVNILYSFKAVILAHVFYNFPLCSSIIGRTWANIDISCTENAKTEGASDFTIFFRVTLPQLKGAIARAFITAFLYCFTSFSIILILGGNPALTTTEVEIYRLGRISVDFNKASALALFSLFCATICNTLILITGKTENQNELYQYSKRLKGIHFYAYIVLSCIFILSPVLSVVVKSFIYKNTLSFSLNAYSKINLKCVIQTVSIGLLSSLLSTAMALSFIKKRHEWFFIIPSCASSVVTGLSYIMVGRYLSFVPCFILVVLSHSIINMPFALRMLKPALKSIPENLIEEAKTDGADERTIDKAVIYPILMKTIKNTLILCFVLSCGELNASLILGEGKIETIPVIIYRMIGSYNFQGAYALGTILIALTALTVFLS